VPQGSSTVEIELSPAGDGTRLRFTHHDLRSAESVQSHSHGWDHYLSRLQTAAAGGDAGRDPWLDGEM
jgi:Activator of Hsp90 ATPase homolog 1-like protein